MVVHGMVGGTIAAFITACFAGNYSNTLIQISTIFTHSHTLTHLKHVNRWFSVFYSGIQSSCCLYKKWYFLMQTEFVMGNN